MKGNPQEGWRPRKKNQGASVRALLSIREGGAPHESANSTSSTTASRYGKEEKREANVILAHRDQELGAAKRNGDDKRG